MCQWKFLVLMYSANTSASSLRSSPQISTTPSTSVQFAKSLFSMTSTPFLSLLRFEKRERFRPVIPHREAILEPVPRIARNCRKAAHEYDDVRAAKIRVRSGRDGRRDGARAANGICGPLRESEDR